VSLLIRERLCLAYFGVSILRTDSTAGYLPVKYCAIPVAYACECVLDSYFIIVFLLVRHFMPANEVIVRTPRHTTKV